MPEVEKNQFGKLLPYLYDRKEPCPTFAFSVLERFIPGFVFADDFNSPKTIFVGTDSGLSFVGGANSNDAFNGLFLKVCRTNLIEGKRFTLFSGNGGWDELISDCFRKELKQSSRYSFTFQPERYDGADIHLQNSFTVRRLDGAAIKRSQEFDHEYYERFWQSAGHFLDKGFGYSVMKGETEVASECTAIFRGKVYAEIDIYTNAEYRGMGVAKKAAQAFIDHCLRNGMLPRWDCDVENLASMKLADRLGFGEPVMYSIFVKNHH
ncbi:GNAT family N-acetyltransferase [Peribacillus sp. SI8-4]|uniref:GNAT family N-acetyltransferase n=1 Tax=Peribacillus sp. SI8-4 TaxID=3048009 RepID=UPI0025553E55|nr:GNAT family N-acetyltransferase [Peribacillus sp. SI8-4]